MESNSVFGTTKLCHWVGQCSGAAWVGAAYLAAGLEGKFPGKLLGHLPGAIIGPARHIYSLWEVCLVPGNPHPRLLHALQSSTNNHRSGYHIAYSTAQRTAWILAPAGHILALWEACLVQGHRLHFPPRSAHLDPHELSDHYTAPLATCWCGTCSADGYAWTDVSSTCRNSRPDVHICHSFMVARGDALGFCASKGTENCSWHRNQLSALYS